MSGDCVLIPTENFNHIMTRTSYLSEVQESDIYSVAILGQSFPTPNQPLCALSPKRCVLSCGFRTVVDVIAL